VNAYLVCNTNFKLKTEGTCVSGQRISLAGGRLWQLAVVTATGALSVVSQSEAAIYYWQDTAPATTQSAPKATAGHAKARRHGDKKSDAAANEANKPHGPLIISVSIAQQKLRIYDANGLFAETSISTGMAGHPTPMGVFSVIQKQKFHQSNIYSGAPMPFMQRITWSGIAMHAGVLPGHPASHGCIRMPMAFAVKMYGWTRMGARVVVTPGDVTPSAFSHPLLAPTKVPPQPVAAAETKADLAAVQRPEMSADTEAKNTAAAIADTRIELRPTVGHAEDGKRATDESHPSTPAQIRTADASGALPARLPSGVTSDAAPAAKQMPPPVESATSDKPDVSKAVVEAEVSKSQTEPTTAKPDEMASSDEKLANDQSVETEATKPESAVSETVQSNPAGQPAAVASPAEAPKAGALVQSDKPADAAQAATPAPAATPLKGDLKSDFANTAAAASKRSGQIAIFVSRKDSKLYVRQNFSPLFDTPVTIAADERPLGTHIFTAQVDKSDANVLHWSVVSLPSPTKSADRRGAEARSSHGRRPANAAPVEAKPAPLPDSPAEALDRLSLPAAVMARIYEAVSTGGSIIVSDQGIAAGETGEGTDFIVSLR
jgi:lipoprotein-anchoring transpeptidase ErfK/SrfK